MIYPGLNELKRQKATQIEWLLGTRIGGLY